jgi:hypothetical protein
LLSILSARPERDRWGQADTAGAYLLWPKTERITALRLLPIAGPNESALILTGRF